VVSAAARIYVPFAVIAGALIFAPRGPVFWGLLAAAALWFALFPAIVQALLGPLERAVLAATPSTAPGLLDALRSERRVRWFAPFAWTALQEGRLHLVRGEGRASAKALTEAVRLAGTMVQPPPVIVSTQAHALLIADAPEQARDLLHTLVKRQALGPWEQLHLAAAQLLAGKPRAEEVRAHLDAAQAALGGTPRVLATRALLEQRAGASEAALSALRGAEAGLEAQPDKLALALVERARRLLRPAVKASEKRVRKHEARAAERKDGAKGMSAETGSKGQAGKGPGKAATAMKAAPAPASEKPREVVSAGAGEAATAGVNAASASAMVETDRGGVVLALPVGSLADDGGERTADRDDSGKPRGKRNARREERRAARRTAKAERRATQRASSPPARTVARMTSKPEAKGPAREERVEHGRASAAAAGSSGMSEKAAAVTVAAGAERLAGPEIRPGGVAAALREQEARPTVAAPKLGEAVREGRAGVGETREAARGDSGAAGPKGEVVREGRASVGETREAVRGDSGAVGAKVEKAVGETREAVRGDSGAVGAKVEKAVGAGVGETREAARGDSGAVGAEVEKAVGAGGGETSEAVSGDRSASGGETEQAVREDRVKGAAEAKAGEAVRGAGIGGSIGAVAGGISRADEGGTGSKVGDTGREDRSEKTASMAAPRSPGAAPPAGAALFGHLGASAGPRVGAPPVSGAGSRPGTSGPAPAAGGVKPPAFSVPLAKPPGPGVGAPSPVAGGTGAGRSSGAFTPPAVKLPSVMPTSAVPTLGVPRAAGEVVPGASTGISLPLVQAPVARPAGGLSPTVPVVAVMPGAPVVAPPVAGVGQIVSAPAVAAPIVPVPGVPGVPVVSVPVAPVLAPPLAGVPVVSVAPVLAPPFAGAPVVSVPPAFVGSAPVVSGLGAPAPTDASPTGAADDAEWDSMFDALDDAPGPKPL